MSKIKLTDLFGFASYRRWILPLFMALTLMSVYAFCVMQVAGLKAQAAAEAGTPSAGLFALAMNNFMLRIGCFLLAPVLLVRVSLQSILGAITAVAGTIGLVCAGMLPHAIVWAIVSVLCTVLTFAVAITPGVVGQLGRGPEHQDRLVPAAAEMPWWKALSSRADFMAYWTTPKVYPNGSTFSPAETLRFTTGAVLFLAAFVGCLIWLLRVAARS